MNPCECKQCTCTQSTRRPDRICRECDMQRLTLAIVAKKSVENKTQEEIEVIIATALRSWSAAQ
jgi:hypothetical protein